MSTRQLIVFRHAKSDRPPGMRDEERPLSERGRRDATAAGSALQTLDPRVDLVVCSPAQRARETWDRAAASYPDGPPLRLDERIYEAEVDDLMEVLHELPENVGVAVLVGHNPGLEDLVVSWPGVPRGTRSNGSTRSSLPRRWRLSACRRRGVNCARGERISRRSPFREVDHGRATSKLPSTHDPALRTAELTAARAAQRACAPGRAAGPTSSFGAGAVPAGDTDRSCTARPDAVTRPVDCQLRRGCRRHRVRDHQRDELLLKIELAARSDDPTITAESLDRVVSVSFYAALGGL